MFTTAQTWIFITEMILMLGVMLCIATWPRKSKKNKKNDRPVWNRGGQGKEKR